MSLADELRQCRSLFIDTAVVIYHIEAHPKFGPLAREVVRRFCPGEAHAFTSVVTLVEVLPKPVAAGNEELAGKFLDFLSHTRNLDLLEITAGIAEDAGRLRAKYRALRAADAIQVAAAIRVAADALVTNDQKLKQIEELRVLLLSDYV
ncbi:MAG TPA: PIN domain-containing protein [Planctomycetota bacterium]|nr:PIN domain-containing protein [Planctomycetota bacterium]